MLTPQQAADLLVRDIRPMEQRYKRKLLEVMDQNFVIHLVHQVFEYRGEWDVKLFLRFIETFFANTGKYFTWDETGLSIWQIKAKETNG